MEKETAASAKTYLGPHGIEPELESNEETPDGTDDMQVEVSLTIETPGCSKWPKGIEPEAPSEDEGVSQFGTRTTRKMNKFHEKKIRDRQKDAERKRNTRNNMVPEKRAEERKKRCRKKEKRPKAPREKNTETKAAVNAHTCKSNKDAQQRRNL